MADPIALAEEGGDWPGQGLSLKEALIRLAGEARYEAWRSAHAQRPRTAIAGGAPLSEVENRRSAADSEAYRALLAPLLGAWNGGKLVADGRPNDSFDRVRLSPPANDWRLRIVDLERAVIRDPRRSRAIICDVRFCRPRASSRAEKPWRRKPYSKAEFNSAMLAIDSKYPSGAQPSFADVWEELKGILPGVTRRQAKDALKYAPRLKGRPGYRSSKS